LLGPETVVSQRRPRTLGLGAAVRAFDELAVPGLGGVWFGKQLFLATLGVAVAEKVRGCGMPVQNIEVTNAVEALACWLGLDDARPGRRGGTVLVPCLRRSADWPAHDRPMVWRWLTDWLAGW